MTTRAPIRLAARIRSAVDQVFGPVSASQGTAQRRLLLTRSVFAYFVLISTLVQIVVWLTIAIFRGHLDSPWWLLTALPGAALVGVLTLIDRWRIWWSSTTPANAQDTTPEPSGTPTNTSR
jgi:hypothetical protein